jgi:beta-lactamase regulating signal transducer with metallopeptidase domain
MNWLTSFTPDWSQVLAFLLDSALKGTVIIAIAAAAAWMLRRSTAAARHSVWSAAIAAQLVIPAFAALLPTWRIPMLDEPAWVAPAATTSAATPPDASTFSPPANPLATAPAPQDRVESSPSSALPQATPAPEPRRVSPFLILAALWLLGCIAVLTRLAAGTAVVSRMALRGERVTDDKWLGLMHRLAVGLGIRRPLTLLRGDALGVPVTWGIVYPIVLLPEDADRWPEERRRYVLVHEMAHVKRLDAFTQLVAQFVLAIFWFNPLVWVAAAQMRRERENACDDYVLMHGTRPSEYASDLLELVQEIDTEGHRRAAPAFAALAMARRSEFEGRMLSILNPRIRRSGLTRTGVIMGLLTAIIVTAPLAAFSPFSPQRAPAGFELPDSFKVSISGVTTNTASPSPVGSGAADSMATSPGAETTKSTGSAIEACDKVTNSTGTSTSIHDSRDRPEDRTIRFVQQTRGRCVEAMLTGMITFSDDERDITGISLGARARFREVTSGTDRELIMTSDAGQLRREYLVNGRAAAYDTEGRAWLAAMIMTLVRESGYNATERVRRLDQQGGTNRVLAEIDAIHSPNGKRTYYEALLDMRKSLSDSTMTRILERMKREFRESSGDLRSVLQKITPASVRTAQTRTAFADAIASIESDGDKSSLLTELAMTADRELLIEIMGVALTLGSDGDKSRLLIAAAARYLGNSDQQLRESWFEVAESLESDGDRSRVLISASAYGHADEAVTEAAIRATLGMESDGDIANVLTYIATQRLLTTSRIRDAYMNAARNIDSDGDRARVLRAAMLD